MAYKEIDKTVISKKVFDAVLHEIGWSYRRLGREFSNNRKLNESNTRSERAIRDAVKRGKMRSDVLDEICKLIDIEPDYISGKLFREIWKLNLPKNAKWSIIHSMTPEKYRYGTQNARDVTFHYIDDLLSLHSVAPQQYKDLKEKEQLDFAKAIEEAVVPVIAEYFPTGADGSKILPDAYWLLFEIENAIDDLGLSLEEPSFDSIDNEARPFAGRS